MIRQFGQNVGVTVPAKEHGQVAIAAQIEWKQNVLVPEDIDLLAPIPRIDRVDGPVVEGALIVERRHPATHGRGSQQSSQLYRQAIQLFHRGFLAHRLDAIGYDGHSPENTSVAAPVI